MAAASGVPVSNRGGSEMSDAPEDELGDLVAGMMRPQPPRRKGTGDSALSLSEARNSVGGRRYSVTHLWSLANEQDVEVNDELTTGKLLARRVARSFLTKRRLHIVRHALLFVPFLLRSLSPEKAQGS
jgi:hypothetical protein